MNLNIGIVGKPSEGKSTAFNALSGTQKAKVGDFDFCTIEPNYAVVDVIDERLQKLAETSKSKKIIYSSIKYIDIAGLVKGASEDKGLGNQFLSSISQVDMIILLVRCFKKEGEALDPEENAEIIQEELIKWDIKILEAAKKKNPKLIPVIAFLREKKTLSQYFKLNPKDIGVIQGLSLITNKPVLIVANVSSMKLDKAMTDKVKEYSEKKNTPFCIINAQQAVLEQNFTPEEIDFFLEGRSRDQDTGIQNLIQQCFSRLDLISFFTTGPQETRAWKIKRNTIAPEAAGVIHTDFIKGFICAQVCNYNDFDKNHWQTKGKDYLVQDGDVIVFKTRN